MRSICQAATPTPLNAESTLMLLASPQADQAAMTGLLQLTDLLDTIDIDESLARCWNGKCKADSGFCNTINEATALRVHQGLRNVNGCKQEGSILLPAILLSTNDPDDDPLYDTQKIDVCVLQFWLMSRLWHLCFTHNLLLERSNDQELEFNYATTIAASAVNICHKFSTRAMEVHGVGFVSLIY